MATVLLGAPSGQAQVVLLAADLRVSGSVEERPPGDGVTTGSEMRYRITIENRGPDPVPANGLALLIFVDRSDSTQTATIEVSRFSSGGLKNIPGSSCGRGRHQVIRCTNRQQLEPDQEITLDIGHRHPAAISGQLSFFAEVTSRDRIFVDPGENNNGYRGPSYVFRNPPPTTTTTAPTTSVPPSTTTTVVESTTTTDGNESTTTSDGSTSTTEATTTSTSEATTTTTEATTTTTEATTTTTEATTTSTSEPTTTTTEATTTTTLELRNGSDATLISPASTPDPSNGSGGDGDEGVAVALGPQAEDDGGGPPFLLIGGLLAALVLLGGVGLAAYTYYDRDPPLVDIRQFN